MTRRFSLVVSLCSAILLLSLMWPLVTRQVFPYGNLEDFNIPLRQAFQRALQNGDSVLWTSDIFSGYYVHGEGQGGFFHPLHQALYRVLPLDVGFNGEMLLGYGAAFAGMFVLLGRFGVRTAASLFGAMLFGFGGFTLMHVDHVNMVAVFAHIPWLLAIIDVFIQAQDRRRFAAGYAGVAVVVASATLLGFPQGVWWNLFVGGSFTIFRGAQARRWWRVPAVALAIGTGLTMAGIQLLPTIDMSAGSIRPWLPRDFAVEFSLHPLNVLQFWSPYAFRERIYSARDPWFLHEFGIYSGAILMIAPAWLWIRRRDLGRQRPLVLAAAAFAAVTLVLALGRYGGLDVALTYLPVLKMLRAPVRYIGLFQLSLTVLAAIAIDDLLQFAQRGERLSSRPIAILSIPAMLSVGTTLVFNALPYARLAGFPFSSVPRAAVGMVLVLTTTAFVVLTTGGVKWAPAALAIVTMLDLGLWGIREVWRRPPETIASLTERIPEPGPGDDRNVYVLDADMPGNLVTLKGYRLASGFVGLPPRTNYHISSIISLQLSGTHSEFALSTGKKPVPSPVARARLLARAEVTGDFRHDWPRVDLHEAALVDHPIGLLTGPPGVARVLMDRPGEILVQTEAPGRQLLSVSERFYPGWRATVDGRPVDTIAVHGDFLGCVVEGGQRRARFHFMPASFTNGVMTSLAGLAGLILAVGCILAFCRPRPETSIPV